MKDLSDPSLFLTTELDAYRRSEAIRKAGDTFSAPPISNGTGKGLIKLATRDPEKYDPRHLALKSA